CGCLLKWTLRCKISCILRAASKEYFHRQSRVYLENNITSNKSFKFLCQKDALGLGILVNLHLEMIGLRIPGDQRQITPALPLHLVDVITVGMYSKNTRHQITSVDRALCCRYDL
ncbi:hypothetical protein CFP56_031912, partial [Quercus suber]